LKIHVNFPVSEKRLSQIPEIPDDIHDYSQNDTNKNQGGHREEDSCVTLPDIDIARQMTDPFQEGGCKLKDQPHDDNNKSRDDQPFTHIVFHFYKGDFSCFVLRLLCSSRHFRDGAQFFLCAAWSRQ